MRGSFLAKHIDQIEMVQGRAVDLSVIWGREGVTSEREALGLEITQDRRNDARVKPLLKILSRDTNSPLADKFNNITAQQTAFHFHVARSVTSYKLLAITATKQLYFNSFLPKISRDLREL